MANRRLAFLVAVLGVALIAAPGCVSKKLFGKNIEDTDGRIVAVESAVEANERRVSDLKRETDSKLGELAGDTKRALQLGNDAMSTARSAETTAQNAASGKLLWSVALTNDAVKFAFGKAMLSSDAMAALDGLVRNVKSAGKGVYLEIEGHTDNTGSDSFNYALGKDRAMAVMKYLHEKGGLPLHAMNVISYGESRPVADNTSRDGRAQNRRVVVKVLE